MCWIQAHKAIIPGGNHINIYGNIHGSMVGSSCHERDCVLRWQDRAATFSVCVCGTKKTFEIMTWGRLSKSCGHCLRLRMHQCRYFICNHLLSLSSSNSQLQLFIILGILRHDGNMIQFTGHLRPHDSRVFFSHVISLFPKILFTGSNSLYSQAYVPPCLLLHIYIRHFQYSYSQMQ